MRVPSPPHNLHPQAPLPSQSGRKPGCAGPQHRPLAGQDPRCLGCLPPQQVLGWTRGPGAWAVSSAGRAAEARLAQNSGLAAGRPVLFSACLGRRRAGGWAPGPWAPSSSGAEAAG